MLKNHVLAAAAAAFVSVAAGSPAFAGFVATSGADAVANNDTFPAGGSPGDSFFVSEGSFDTYTPTGPNDPQITSDLDRYGYEIGGTINTISGSTATYIFTSYRLFYDINNDENYDAGTDTSISFGDVLNLQATFTGANTATFSGQLSQTQGPTGPFSSNFADFGARYGGNPADFSGLYVDDNPLGPSPSGTIRSTLIQTATAVPSPSAALAGMALLSVVGMKRRRSV